MSKYDSSVENLFAASKLRITTIYFNTKTTEGLFYINTHTQCVYVAVYKNVYMHIYVTDSKKREGPGTYPLLLTLAYYTC